MCVLACPGYAVDQYVTSLYPTIFSSKCVVQFEATVEVCCNLSLPCYRTPCAEGYYAYGGAVECTPCPEGSYCPSATNGPNICPLGKYSEARSTNCTTCEAGFRCPEAPGNIYLYLDTSDNLCICLRTLGQFVHLCLRIREKVS